MPRCSHSHMIEGGYPYIIFSFFLLFKRKKLLFLWKMDSVWEREFKLSHFVNDWIELKLLYKEAQTYLTKLDSSDIFHPLLIPYSKSQIVRIVAVLINLDCDILVWVATRNTVCREERERASLVNFPSTQLW